MPRVTHCKNCGKEIDESIRFNSIQEFGVALCSAKCAIQYMED
jgi:hypothetical protein